MLITTFVDHKLYGQSYQVIATHTDCSGYVLYNISIDYASNNQRFWSVFMTSDRCQCVRVFQLPLKITKFCNFSKNEKKHEWYPYKMTDYSMMKIDNQNQFSIFIIYRFIPFWWYEYHRNRFNNAWFTTVLKSFILPYLKKFKKTWRVPSQNGWLLHDEMS